MLDKMKELGSQLGTKAAVAADDMKQSMKHSVAETSDKAVRGSIEKMRSMLEIALEELKNKPISDKPATLTASVTIGLISLQIQITTPEEKS